MRLHPKMNKRILKTSAGVLAHPAPNQTLQEVVFLPDKGIIHYICKNKGCLRAFETDKARAVVSFRSKKENICNLLDL